MPRYFLSLLAAAAASVALLSACSNTPEAAVPVAAVAYRVDAAQSQLQFVTLKAGQAGAGGVAEVQQFTRFSGGVDAAGAVVLDIDLASVDTGVAIRDERLRTMLFNVPVNPRARFSAQIDPGLVKDLAVGAARDIDAAGQLRLAGQSRDVKAQLRVVRLASGGLQVSTRSPLVIDLAAFGLKPGVEALREVMGLNFLAAAAPVSLTLVLHAQR
jgi:polyisoprenoid-binding protein YceI